jgi:hypothetical protein
MFMSWMSKKKHSDATLLLRWVMPRVNSDGKKSGV